MSYEDFIKVNENLLYAIINNKQRMYFSVRNYKLMKKYFDIDDLYQELLTKLHEVYSSYDNDRNVKRTTYITTICKNHLLTLIQPYKAKNKWSKYIVTNIDVNTLKDDIDYEELYVNKMTVEEIRKIAKESSNSEILLLLLSGLNQSQVARLINVSRQYVNQLWLQFIKEVKER